MNLERIPPYLWLAFDWSAAELCYIALQARDPVLKAMVESGDPHTWTARELGYRNATKTDPIREACKSVNYALVYSGMDLNVARAICIKKNPDIDPAMVDFAISRYPSMFPRLFEWADEALCEWYDRGGYVTYAMGSVKKIEVPAYAQRDPEKMRVSSPGRLAINTYGQNSIGFLLKKLLAETWQKDMYRSGELGRMVQVFDSCAWQVRTDRFAETWKVLHGLASAMLEGHGGFTVNLTPEWRVSDRSWGDCEEIDPALYPVLEERPVWHCMPVMYEAPARAKLEMPPATLSPFLGGITPEEV